MACWETLPSRAGPVPLTERRFYLACLLGSGFPERDSREGNALVSALRGTIPKGGAGGKLNCDATAAEVSAGPTAAFGIVPN